MTFYLGTDSKKYVYAYVYIFGSNKSTIAQQSVMNRGYLKTAWLKNRNGQRFFFFTPCMSTCVAYKLGVPVRL